MSRYPCGTCGIGVRYKGILCTGPCKKWFHSKCLNWTDQKLKNLTNETTKTWKCTNCELDESSSNIDEIQTKILQLTSEENLDHETSLTLAAEIGTALLSENNTLKQKLHEIKSEKSLNELELEDKVKTLESIIEGLAEENINLKQEVTYMTEKIENEKSSKNELIKEAEEEKAAHAAQMHHLLLSNSELKDRTTQTEAELKVKELENKSLKKENNNLFLANQSLKTKLDERYKNTNMLQADCESLNKKLTNQEMAAKAFLKSFFNATKLNFDQNLGSKGKDECESNNEIRKLNHSTPKVLKPAPSSTNVFTTSLLAAKYQNSCRMNQTSVQGNLNQNLPQIRKEGFSSFSPEQNSGQTSRRVTQKVPPCTAKIRHKEENVEEFFKNHIEYYKSINKSFHTEKKDKILPSTSSLTSDDFLVLRQEIEEKK